MPELVLETDKISKAFGGLAAVNQVSLGFEVGRVHAVIGPNGAGKTTLINLLSGDLAPDSGSVRFKGRDISGLPPNRISRLGIGRSYQRTNIFPAFTCRRNCWLAAASRLPPAIRGLRPASAYPEVAARAEEAMARTGLQDRGETVAADLSYGEQRQLEIAMMLATDPEVLLLDEPMAGMGPEESARVLELVRELAVNHAVMLVEHDMDAVFALADRLTVMVAGRVLESATPEEVRRNRAVREAYLGEDMPMNGPAVTPHAGETGP
ncbi:MAG: ABC transporter ATP-binding protein [Rhodovibrionaceae bacterium]|nr:ABC transporter ATP-binding protein [Rhodovibrionaceae bacterium]